MARKQIVSVSLGSSRRDHQVEVTLLGHPFSIRRQGTDGDFRKAMALLEELDGKVDAIGLGGVDIYLCSRTRRYALRDGLKLAQVVKKTPVVDGSGLKNTLEREVVKALALDHPLSSMRVLMVSGMDRFGMAQAFSEAGARMVFGDLIFALGVDRAITTLDELEETAEKLLPDVCKLPIGMIYPIGKTQEEKPEPRYARYYDEADCVAGDYHFIRKYMPERIDGKMIVTNTVTPADLGDLESRGVATLVTTTPEFEGRSFGTNVLEAALIALLGKPWEAVTPDDYFTLIRDLGLKPRIVNFRAPSAAGFQETRKGYDSATDSHR
ncbi:MAG: quinate 5-dehydrogenase [Armatimonadetes bacterium]|nr:quinate 5-dehydrogenase [Armatimonadota bacterium]